MLKKVEKEELDAGGFGTKCFSRPVEEIQKPGRNQSESGGSDEGDASETDNEEEIGNDERLGAEPNNGDQFNPYGIQYLIDTIWRDHDTLTRIEEYPYNAQIDAPDI
ncbi:hypothetical protein Tco_0192779 [Tanacetum coccineum]